MHQLSIDAKQIKPFSRLRQHIKNSRIDDCNHMIVLFIAGVFYGYVFNNYFKFV